MPQASTELQAEWGVLDVKATKFLESKGYILTRQWTWIKPTPNHVMTDKEWRAMRFLVEEWDFGGESK